MLIVEIHSKTTLRNLRPHRTPRIGRLGGPVARFGACRVTGRGIAPEKTTLNPVGKRARRPPRIPRIRTLRHARRSPSTGRLAHWCVDSRRFCVKSHRKYCNYGRKSVDSRRIVRVSSSFVGDFCAHMPRGLLHDTRTSKARSTKTKGTTNRKGVT